MELNTFAAAVFKALNTDEPSDAWISPSGSLYLGINPCDYPCIWDFSLEKEFVSVQWEFIDSPDFNEMDEEMATSLILEQFDTEKILAF